MELNSGYGKGVVPLPPGGTSGGTTRAFKNIVFWSNQSIFRFFFQVLSEDSGLLACFDPKTSNLTAQHLKFDYFLGLAPHFHFEIQKSQYMVECVNFVILKSGSHVIDPET